MCLAVFNLFHKIVFGTCCHEQYWRRNSKLELLPGLTHEAPLWYGYFLDKKVLQDSINSNLFRSDSFDIIFIIQPSGWQDSGKKYYPVISSSRMAWLVSEFRLFFVTVARFFWIEKTQKCNDEKVWQFWCRWRTMQCFEPILLTHLAFIWNVKQFLSTNAHEWMNKARS